MFNIINLRKMTVQKIIGILIICSYLLFYGCGVPSTEPSIVNTDLIDSVLVDQTTDINDKIRDNCLTDIGLEMTDSVFLYWAELAINKKDLYDHAGNLRILITQDKKIYYSRNKGPIKSVDNYFNTDLFFFKSLSDDRFLQLKDSLGDWNVLGLPSTMSNENFRYNGGTETYLYLNLEGNKSCTKFDMGITERIKIEALLKAIQE
jgi:hypothetical protein